MANHCVYCDRVRPPEPVRTIILGEEYIECCAECYDSGAGHFTNNETGETATFAELWALQDEHLLEITED